MKRYGYLLSVPMCLVIGNAPALSADACKLNLSFKQADEQGTQRVNVYEDKADAALGGAKPLLFVSDLKVNTDGTRISYKVDDPRAKNGAINNILNAMPRGRKIAEFETVAKNDWQPLDQTWRVLLKNVIERNQKTGKPCVGKDNFLVSMTADVSVAGGFGRIGDCDQSKWLDALTIPALVLPGGSTFQAKGARTRSVVVVMSLKDPTRIVLGIVGDTGPSDELGEASVEMNRMLNGLPAGDIPKDYNDAKLRFQASKSAIFVLPGEANRVAYPITPDRVREAVQAKFDAWGGKERLQECLKSIPEGR